LGKEVFLRVPLFLIFINVLKKIRKFDTLIVNERYNNYKYTHNKYVPLSITNFHKCILIKNNFKIGSGFMYKVNDKVNIRRRNLFGKAEALNGKIVKINNYTTRTYDGFLYNETHYDVELANSKKVVGFNKLSQPYLKKYDFA